MHQSKLLTEKASIGGKLSVHGLGRVQGVASRSMPVGPACELAVLRLPAEIGKELFNRYLREPA